MLVPSGIHAKYPIPRNAESFRNPRFSRAFTSKITHSIPRRPFSNGVAGIQLGSEIMATAASGASDFLGRHSRSKTQR